MRCLMNSRTFARLPPEPEMPAGLIELMEGLTREVLKNNPSNVYEFCTNHMQKLLEIRDGRAPKIPLTLEQKIKIAQKKVGQKAEERRRKYDEEIKSEDTKETAVTTQTPEYDAERESIPVKPLHGEIKETVRNNLNAVQRNVTDDKEIELSHETYNNKDDDIIPTSESNKAEEKEAEIFETPKNTFINDGSNGESIDEHVDISGNELSKSNGDASLNQDMEGASAKIQDVGNVDDKNVETKVAFQETTKSKPSSFDAFIEEEMLPNKNDLDNMASLITDQNMAENEKYIARSYEDDILDDNETSNQLENNKNELNVRENDEYRKDQENLNSLGLLSVENKPEIAGNADNTTNLSNKVNSEYSKNEQFFRADTESVSNAHENNLLYETDKIKGDEVSSANPIKNDEILIVNSLETTDKIDVSAKLNETSETRLDEASFNQNTNVNNRIVIDFEPVTTGKAVGLENGDESLPKNIFVINEVVNFGHVLDTSEQGCNEYSTRETVNGDARLNEDSNSEVNQERVISKPSEEGDNVEDDTETLGIQNDIVTDAIAANELHKITESASTSENINNQTDPEIAQDGKDLSNNILNDENMENIQNDDIKVIGSLENISQSSITNKDRQTTVSEPICQKKTVSLLTVPPNNFMEEGTITRNTKEINQNPINTNVDNANSNKQMNDAFAEKDGETLQAELNTVVSNNEEPQIVGVKLMDKSSYENCPRHDESSIHDESTASERSDEFSNELNPIQCNMNNNSKSNDDPSSTVNAKVESENSNNFDEQRDATSNTMDLETAAITIQKHFRTFMCKSRCSTFEDSSNDDHTSTDEDADREQIEYQGSPNLNKERRALGLNRMESVLQTVNEEKSLSLSTDDSSISSAVTVIQARVRGFLTRKRLGPNSKPLINSNDRSTSDNQKENKTVLNIHIVPEGEHFVSRDESLLESIDLSLDGSPPLSTNLHPLGYDKSEPRKQLKREDAVQSFSPPSNNSDKLIENTGGVGDPLQYAELTEEQKNDDSVSDPVQNVDAGSCDTTPTRSTTIDTVIEAPNYSQETAYTATGDVQRNDESTERNSLHESNVATPVEDRSSMDSDNTSKLLHSGEFHDALLPLSPTQISRNTTVVREFKNVLGLLLLWK